MSPGGVMGGAAAALDSDFETFTVLLFFFAMTISRFAAE
jgi:hypothetical protein